MLVDCPAGRLGTSNVATRLLFIKTLAFWAGPVFSDLFSTLTCPFWLSEKIYFLQSQAKGSLGVVGVTDSFLKL